jgi:hypothetical protein
MQVNPALTVFWKLMGETPIAELINEIGGELGFFNTSLECAFNLLSTLQTNTNASLALAFKDLVAHCFSFEAMRVAILQLQHDGALDPNKVAKLGVLLNKAQRWFLWLKVASYSITGFDTLFASNAGLIGIDHYAAKPTVDAHGRRAMDACIVAHGLGWTIDEGCQDGFYTHHASAPPGSGGTAGFPNGLLARDRSPEGHVWFINTDTHVAQPVDSGGVYLCLANHYIVDWNAVLGTYLTSNGGPNTFDPTPATCTDSTDTRPINPASLGSGSVLRQSDGTAWVIMGAKRYHITSPGEFECWVEKKYPANIESDVWDQVTPAQVAQWPEETVNTVSNCGDPAHPTF